MYDCGSRGGLKNPAGGGEVKTLDGGREKKEGEAG